MIGHSSISYEVLTGRKRRSVTLVGEADRKMLKTAIKHAAIKDSVRHRQVPPEVVAKWSSNLDDLKQEVSEILQEEKEEKQVYIVSCLGVLFSSVIHLLSSSVKQKWS